MMASALSYAPWYGNRIRSGKIPLFDVRIVQIKSDRARDDLKDVTREIPSAIGIRVVANPWVRAGGAGGPLLYWSRLL